MSIDKLDPESQAFVDAERGAIGPTAAVRERVRSRLGATLGIGMGGGLTPGHPASQPTSTPVAAVGKVASQLGWLKVVALVAAVGGVGGGVYLVARSPAAPGPAPASSPPVVAVAPIATVTPVAAVAPVVASPVAALVPVLSDDNPALPVAPAPAVRATPRPRHVDSDPTADLAAERALLEQARAALAAGRSAAAIDAVSRHARQFSRGQLVEERESLWVRALARSGDRDAARARGARFAHRYPHSIFLPAVQATLDSL